MRSLINLRKHSQSGFVDILTAIAILGVVLLVGYYMSQASTDLNKNLAANREDVKLEAAIKYIYEASECCATLAPYQASIDANVGSPSCGSLSNEASNTHLFPQSGMSQSDGEQILQTRRSVELKNAEGRAVLETSNKAGLFPEYYQAGGWNLAVKCVDGATSANNIDNTPSLGISKFADRKDLRTVQSLTGIKQLSDTSGSRKVNLCACSAVFKHGYTVMCGDGQKVYSSYSRRMCDEPIPELAGYIPDGGTDGTGESGSTGGGALGVFPACDASEAESEASAATTYQTIFVSSGSYSPGLGSLAAYDLECEALALARGFPSTGSSWKAVMSTENPTYSGELTDARDRILLTGEIRNSRRTNNSGDPCSGDKIADAGSDIFVDGISTPIEFEEDGSQAGGGVRAMTGSNSDGTAYSGGTCNSWTSTSDSRRYKEGKVNLSSNQWFEGSGGSGTKCNNVNADKARIYCINGQID